MSLTLVDLQAGVKLPSKDVYIYALEDSITIQPVALERYNEYIDKTKQLLEDYQAMPVTDETVEARKTAAAEISKADEELMDILVAESLSMQDGLTLEKAREINESVRTKLHPAAFREIQAAVRDTMTGESSVGKG